MLYPAGYWLPTAGKLERDAELAVVIEPSRAETRRHVVGDDDSGRGRLHRSEHLQLCLRGCLTLFASARLIGVGQLGHGDVELVLEPVGEPGPNWFGGARAGRQRGIGAVCGTWCRPQAL
jgi:hypothetical protein